MFGVAMFPLNLLCQEFLHPGAISVFTGNSSAEEQGPLLSLLSIPVGSISRSASSDRVGYLHCRSDIQVVDATFSVCFFNCDAISRPFGSTGMYLGLLVVRGLSEGASPSLGAGPPFPCEIASDVFRLLLAPLLSASAFWPSLTSSSDICSLTSCLGCAGVHFSHTGSPSWP